MRTPAGLWAGWRRGLGGAGVRAGAGWGRRGRGHGRGPGRGVARVGGPPARGAPRSLAGGAHRALDLGADPRPRAGGRTLRTCGDLRWDRARAPVAAPRAPTARGHGARGGGGSEGRPGPPVTADRRGPARGRGHDAFPSRGEGGGPRGGPGPGAAVPRRASGRSAQPAAQHVSAGTGGLAGRPETGPLGGFVPGALRAVRSLP